MKRLRFVICNEGYTIERYIHGAEEEYNDIQPWKHSALVEAFGAYSQSDYSSYEVRNRNELEDLFSNRKFSSALHFQVGENKKRCQPASSY